ncbi:MAG TPA: glycosyltransferase family 2 protein [Ferruginibacter sp.]|nr:glycosyltransferase family 2 protein [Ferruginibacter sp.]
MQLSIIIVNYNVKYFLEQCLYSVQKACANITAEVFVVDNHSTDGSREYLINKFPWVIFKWNTTNDGFGKASNSVLPEASGEHILFLNPDTIVPEDCFERCLSFFATNKNCGALGVRMLDGSGRFLKESKRGFPSPVTSFFKMSGLAGMFPASKLFACYYAGHLPQKENNEVEVLAGAFMMLSKKAVELTGGFDEDFFMYGEDVDLSYRIRQAGLKNYYFADTTILHFKGESTQKISADYVKHFYGAMLLFVKKHYSDKKATVFFMKKAIGFSKAIASLKIKRIKDEQQKPLPDAGVNTAVVAGQQKFNECLQLIKYAVPPVMLAGRISIDVSDKNAAIGNLDDLKKCIKKNKIEQLLFCEGELTYEAIIQQVENIRGKTNFLFNAQGSNSIVGSSDKNARGIFIAKP